MLLKSPHSKIRAILAGREIDSERANFAQLCFTEPKQDGRNPVSMQQPNAALCHASHGVYVKKTHSPIQTSMQALFFIHSLKNRCMLGAAAFAELQVLTERK